MKFLSLAITGMQSSKLIESGYQKKKEEEEKKQCLIPWWLQDLLSLLQAKKTLSN